MAKLASVTPAITSTKQPSFSGMSHVSLACRDLEEAKLFYSRVLGGELVHEIPGFVEYRIADMVFGLSEQSGGWTGADDEYPHYALYIDGENFTRMKDWLDGAKRFYTQVPGGELIHDVDGFAEVRLAGVIIGLTVRPGSVTARDAEYPHYAFFVEAEDFLPTVDWLRRNGVVTTEPWTRDGIKGLLYFRDPAGNLLEMYCRRIEAASRFARGAKQSGDYAIDFSALSYSWPG